MVEYTFEEYTEMLIIYAKLDVMVELHNATMKNALRIAALHHIISFSSDFNNSCERYLPS